MPSITPLEWPMLSPSKKRRRDDDHGSVQQVPLYGSSKPFRSLPTNSDGGSRPHAESTNLISVINNNNNNERLIFPSSGRGAASLLNMPRKVIPLPANKRFRLISEEDDDHLHSHNQQSHLSHAHPEYSTPPASPQRMNNTKANPPALLNPCHICHRKPTKKSDLDSFADCMGCGQRACFVCIRACQGWLPTSEEEEDLSASFTMQDVDDAQDRNPKQRKGGGSDGGWIGRGHREMVCSRCCVERGPEGDVVCLGCLAGMEGA
ncbi:hypothetical protein F5Y13DRAFT_121394 [Hypoxylon sp. FL1857]|nr:hypothetical protein F5Y13DRAFT_121394 [Hypoxylon sp. FL1857]